MKQLSTAISNYLVRFFYIQMFITLASLPILINWGLPLSIMGPFANLIFTPFLMLFLFFASLIFFSELIYLPNGYLIYALECLVKCWSYILSLHSPLWLISFTKPSLIFLTLLLGLTFFILHTKKAKTMLHALGSFILLLCCLISYFTWQRPDSSCITLACNRGTITILKSDNQTILIDPGYLGQSCSTPSWIEYTLNAELHKKLGGNTLDHVIILQPGIFTFEALESLCLHTTIKNMYLVTWQGVGSKNLYRAYGALKRTLNKKNIPLQRIGWHKKSIKLGNNFLEIIPLQEKLPYHEITFPALQVRAKTNTEEITIYSAKLKKKGANHGT